MEVPLYTLISWDEKFLCCVSGLCPVFLAVGKSP